MYDLLIYNAVIVDSRGERQGWVAVTGNIVAATGESSDMPEASEKIAGRSFSRNPMHKTRQARSR